MMCVYKKNILFYILFIISCKQTDSTHNVNDSIVEKNILNSNENNDKIIEIKSVNNIIDKDPESQSTIVKDEIPEVLPPTKVFPIPKLIKCLPGTVIIGNEPPFAFEEYCEKKLIGTKDINLGVTSLHVKDGMYISFYNIPGKTQIKKKGQYKDGKKTGVWNIYREDGALSGTGSYVDGYPDGKWVMWIGKDAGECEGNFSNGNGTVKFKTLTEPKHFRVIEQEVTNGEPQEKCRLYHENDGRVTRSFNLSACTAIYCDDYLDK